MTDGRPASGRASAAAGHGRVPPALHYPLFVRLWAGSIASSVGTQMSNVAKLWALYLVTHSALALGLEGLCFSVPIMVLPLLAGPVSDRVDRRTILKITTAAEVAEAAALAAIAAAGDLHPWVIYLTAGLEATRLAFDIPARTALTTALVPAEALLSAQSLSAVVWNSAALLGPALGGLMLATTGVASVFAINGVSSLAALIVFLPLGQAVLGATHVNGERFAPTSGLQFAWQHRDLLDLQAILLATSTLVIGTETLLPALDRTLWHGGSTGYALLRAAPGMAAVLAGAILAARRAVHSPARAITLSVLGACAGLIGFAQAPNLAVAFVLLLLASLALTTAQVHLVTRVQQVTPDHLRGAISGLSAIAQSGLAGVAAACMALGAASVGARTIIIAIAGITAIAALVRPVRARRFRRGLP